MPHVPSKLAARPAVRLRPVPPLDPPYEDEVAPEIWSARPGPGQLSLDLAAGRATPPGAGGRGAARGVPAPGQRIIPSSALASALASAGPEARQAAKRFLAICLEILNGYRPLAHIRPLVGPAEVDAVLGQLAAGIERLTGPGRAGRRPPAQVRLVRVCEPRPGAAETAVVLGGPTRTWALAFRLERRQGRWVITTFRVL